MSDDLRRAAERFVPGANSNAVNGLRDAAIAAADRIAALETVLTEILSDDACWLAMSEELGDRAVGLLGGHPTREDET